MATTLISQQPSTSSQVPPSAKDYDSLKAQMMVIIFSNKVFLIKVRAMLFRYNAIARSIDYSIV
jgi:hypothetical protein